MKKQKIAEIQELEYQKFKIIPAKANPKAFKRLTAPKAIVIIPPRSPEKKFSIKEAIESGKRLMNKKIIKTASLSNSPIRTTFSAEEFLKTIKVNISSNKISKPVNKGKNIDEILLRCKKNALALTRNNKLLQNPTNFAISTTSSINLIPNANNNFIQ